MNEVNAKKETVTIKIENLKTAMRLAITRTAVDTALYFTKDKHHTEENPYNIFNYSDTMIGWTQNLLDTRETENTVGLPHDASDREDRDMQARSQAMSTTQELLTTIPIDERVVDALEHVNRLTSSDSDDSGDKVFDIKVIDEIEPAFPRLKGDEVYIKSINKFIDPESMEMK